MKDFFISYNKADRQMAEWIAWQLEDSGYTTIIQAWDFRPGANFVLEMNRSTREAERTIIVLSIHYLEAQFTQPEWATAFAQDPSGEKGLLIPIRIDEYDPKGLIPQIIYIDLVGKDEAAAKELLLEGVRRGRSKPINPPNFPSNIKRSIAIRPPFLLTVPRSSFLDSIRDDSHKLVAGHILERARSVPLPPFSVTVDSVIAKIESLLSGNYNVLNELEIFVLLSAACLRHIVFQLGIDDDNLTRHTLVQVIDALQKDTPISLHPTLTEVASEISAIASARAGFEVESAQWNDGTIRNSRIRLRLLGTLLHLATYLNLDQVVDPTPPSNLMNTPWEQRLQWWRQAYVRSVSINEHRVQLHFSLPIGFAEHYTPILVNPLSEELQALIRRYDFVLLSAGINLNYVDPHVAEADVPSIPDMAWLQIKKAVETEQARKLKDRIQQEIVRTQRLRDLLIVSDVEYAERIRGEGRHNEAAEAFARVAELLERAQHAIQSTQYSVKAAEEYLAIGDKESAARHYIRAASTSLESKVSPQLAIHQIEKAEGLVKEINLVSLQAHFLLVQAHYAFAMLQDADAQNYMEQAKKKIPEIDEVGTRVPILRDWAVQYATFALVWEEWEKAREILEAILLECPLTSKVERLDLLIRLVQLATQIGDWSTVDRAYNDAHPLYDKREEPFRGGMIMMHYGVSLARRGDLDESARIFGEAIDLLSNQADAYILGLVYQNMQFALLQNGAWPSEGFERDQAKRIDLFHSTVAQNRGYAHELDATKALSQRQFREALQQIRLALFYYWRDGSWHGIQDGYKTTARLNAETGQLDQALIAAIRGCDEEAVKEYAEALSHRASSELLSNLVSTLLDRWPTFREQKGATLALGIMCDVIPPSLLKSVVDNVIELIEGPERNSEQVRVRHQAADTLRQVVPQLNDEQVNDVLKVVIQQTRRQQFWTITQELLKVIQACIVDPRRKLDATLLEQAAELLLNFDASEPLRRHIEVALVYLARATQSELRRRIVGHLNERADQFDGLGMLAFLGEPIPEDRLEKEIDQILLAINPYPKVEIQDGKKTTTVGISAVNPQSLNQFHHVLPPGMYNRVIDGLLEAIINENNSLGSRSGAIWALSELPVHILATRTNEVADYLLWGAEGSLPRSSLIDMELQSQTDPFSMFRINMGNIEIVRQASLRALGRLYSHVDGAHHDRFSIQLVNGSRDPSPEVRQGVAMALAEIENIPELPSSLLLALVVLLHDDNAHTCSWACVAVGRLIKRNLLKSHLPDIFERVLKLAEVLNTEVRIGVTIGVRTALDSGNLDALFVERASSMLSTLANDRSYRVRVESTRIRNVEN